jgi:hypothetical protein
MDAQRGSGELTLGRRSEGYEHFAGLLDEVRIYDRALNASEISRLASQRNLLANPEFEHFEASTGPCSVGAWRWIFCMTDGAAGGYEAAAPGFEGAGAARIEISVTSGNMQMFQYDFDLAPNTRYRFSFVGYSSTGHDVQVALFKHTADFDPYGLSETYDLGTTWRPFSTVFWTPADVAHPRLVFWLAGHGLAAVGDVYYFDNVELQPYP